MKLWKPISAEANECNYCGRIVVTINDMGGCANGCPGNMKILPHTEETVYVNMKTGDIEYCITVEQSEMEFEG